MEDCRLHELIKDDEGTRLQAYDDKTGEVIRPGYTMVGAPTIGVGRNLLGRGISQLEAFVLFDRDVAECLMDLAILFRGFGEIAEPRKHALADMRFTLGPRGFRKFRKMVAAVEVRDWPEVAAQVRDSVWARKQAPGRAERVAQMLASGQYPT